VSQYRGGTAIAVRLVPAQVPSFEKLGLPGSVSALVAPGAGLVLVAGSAGAGKTTTLAALANEINGERACHIIAIEDPVEIVLPDRRSVVVQREVGLDAPTASAALRAALRQDADVLVVGDLRDAESVELATFAAETGRLVLAGIGARDATSAVDRLAELGGAERPGLRGRIAHALRGIVAQQLVRRADGRGRLAVVELLLCDDETRTDLASAANVAAVRAGLTAGRPAGSQSFDAALIALARARRLTAKDARAHATDVGAVGAALAVDDEATTGKEAREDESEQAAVEDDARPD
jgi:twitching motility protein PilT